MKKPLILILLLVISSCNKKRENIEITISKIRASNYELFNGVRIEVGHESKGVLKTPFLTKEIDGKSYFLPSFEYYDCMNPNENCLSIVSTKKFDILEFNVDHNTDSLIDPYEFAHSYTKPIFDEFHKLDIYRINSHSGIGDCIIFNIYNAEYLAFVPDLDSIKNEFWRLRFVNKNKIAENWYSGNSDLDGIYNK